MVVISSPLHHATSSPQPLPVPYPVRSYHMRLLSPKQKQCYTAEKLEGVKSSGYSKHYHVMFTHGENFIRWRPIKSGSVEFGQPIDGEDRFAKRSKSLIDLLKVFCDFARPYSCIGSVYGVLSSSLIAIESLSDISLPFLIGLLKALVCFLFLNVYSTGINQLFDIDIDKINKPYLPLASGEMTLGSGIAVVSAFTALAFGVAYLVGSRPLLWGIFLYFIVTSAYSVDMPLLRWKKSAIGAGFSLFAMRAILQSSAYLHMQTFVFGRQAKFPKSLAFGIAEIGILFIVVALFKDIPDIEGDKKFGIQSLATRVGEQKVFRICLYLLGIVYTSAIFVGATSSLLWSKLLTISSHAILALLVLNKSKTLDLNDKAAVASFYLFIWRLVFAEFLLIPLVR